MHNHWDKGLKVKDLVLEHKPKLVVECGAGSGENTQQYLSLKMPFEMIVISDGKLPDKLVNEKLLWMFGVSYKQLEHFIDDSIDFCSIDTDHNYFTLNQELNLLKQKLRPGGIVVIHDTVSYDKASGMTDHYNCGEKYPIAISEEAKSKMYGDAIREVLDSNEFHVIKESREHNGAMALQKGVRK